MRNIPSRRRTGGLSSLPRSNITSDGTVCIPLPLDIDRITTLPDETFEDFAKIKNQWGYTYSDERQQELYGIYLSNGGNLEKEVLPVQREGFSLR